MPIKRSFMIHFEITPTCMEAGLSDGLPTDPPDVIDALAQKLRRHPDVRTMLRAVSEGELPKVLIGVGREIQT